MFTVVYCEAPLVFMVGSIEEEDTVQKVFAGSQACVAMSACVEESVGCFEHDAPKQAHATLKLLKVPQHNHISEI